MKGLLVAGVVGLPIAILVTGLYAAWRTTHSKRTAEGLIRQATKAMARADRASAKGRAGAAERYEEIAELAMAEARALTRVANDISLPRGRRQ